jgi:hypothetical protein
MKFRYYVELKKDLKQEKPIELYVMAYNRSHVCNMFDGYFVVTVDRKDLD